MKLTISVKMSKMVLHSLVLTIGLSGAFYYLNNLNVRSDLEVA